MITVREATSSAEYHPNELSVLSHFTQEWMYGDWQQSQGRHVRRFLIEKNGKVTGTFQMIRFNSSWPEGQYLYIPHGPVLHEELSPEESLTLKKYLEKIADEENAFLVHFDIFPQKFPLRPETEIFTPAPKYTESNTAFQPKYEWLVPLSGTEEDILKAMHPKTRYSVNLALRKGVTVRKIYGAELLSYFNTFYELLSETSARNHFGLHEKKYYEEIFKTAVTDPRCMLFVGSIDESVIAMHFVVCYGKIAFYPYGGSRNDGRNSMTTYALHFAAMREAKMLGCEFYNFGAVNAPGGEKTSWEKISEYKRRWGGEMITYADACDIIIDQKKYRQFLMFQKLSPLLRILSKLRKKLVH